MNTPDPFQTFRIEAQELIVELESALLELEERPDDQDLVDRAFRALHTLKGSGAMFGFDRVAAFQEGELDAAGAAYELAAVAAPWGGADFDVFAYGRPEGMTIEHCVLSAAFDRVPTTCRDLCVQKHTNVEITDPAGYTFPVATDSASSV